MSTRRKPAPSRQEQSRIRWLQQRQQRRQLAARINRTLPDLVMADQEESERLARRANRALIDLSLVGPMESNDTTSDSEDEAEGVPHPSESLPNVGFVLWRTDLSLIYPRL
ncbi:MAG: hypothetical protein EBY17_27205 [Acidobacteriia bacterium]|nr:hypothetical protein [Terriglobia bacterium]